MMAMDGGISVPEAARRLSLTPSTSGNWLKAQKAGKLNEIGKNYSPLTDVAMELARTKRDLAQVKIERDIKEAAVYFAKGSLPGMRG